MAKTSIGLFPARSAHAATQHECPILSALVSDVQRITTISSAFCKNTEHIEVAGFGMIKKHAHNRSNRCTSQRSIPL